MIDFETVQVTSKEVSCDGSKGSLGHPRIYLTFPNGKNEVICPYCSRKYILKK